MTGVRPNVDSDSSRMSQRQILEALSGLLLGMFVSMLASTVVSTSLPVIINDLGGDQSAFTWVVTATLLTTAISTPIWGKLADLFDRKLLYQLAIVIFILATAAAGFSQDPGTMIAFRAVQGLGAGGLAALSQVLMADIISPRERGRYMGLFGAIMAVATVGGPLLGGIITDAWGWRWNFYVALPIAIVALFLVQKTLRIPVLPKRRVSIDFVGIVLLSATVSLLLIWVTNAGHDYAWWSMTTAWMLGGAILSAALFIAVELHHPEPLIPLSLFKDPTFTLAVIASVAAGIAMFGSSVYLSQYMQLARGASPTQAGLMTIPMMAGFLTSSTVVGGLITKYGHWKSYLIMGSVSLTAGAYLLSTLRYDTHFALVSLYMFLLGAGVGMIMQNLVLIVQNTSKPSEIGVTSSGVTFFRSLGGTIGVAVMGAIVATRVPELMADRQTDLAKAVASLGKQAPIWAETLRSSTLPRVSEMPEPIRIIFEDVYAQGISAAFFIAVPLAIVGLVAIAFLPNIPLTRLTTAERRQAHETESAPAAMTDSFMVHTLTGSLPVQQRPGSGQDGSSSPEERP